MKAGGHTRRWSREALFQVKHIYFHFIFKKRIGMKYGIIFRILHLLHGMECIAKGNII